MKIDMRRPIITIILNQILEFGSVYVFEDSFNLFPFGVSNSSVTQSLFRRSESRSSPTEIGCCYEMIDWLKCELFCNLLNLFPNNKTKHETDQH